MNPTSIRFTVPPEQYAITDSYEVGLLRAATPSPAPEATPVPAEPALLVSANIGKPPIETDGSIVAQFPATFLSINEPAGSYVIGVRGVNAGGTGPWVLSGPVPLTMTPLAPASIAIS